MLRLADIRGHGVLGPRITMTGSGRHHQTSKTMVRFLADGWRM